MKVLFLFLLFAWFLFSTCGQHPASSYILTNDSTFAVLINDSTFSLRQLDGTQDTIVVSGGSVSEDIVMPDNYDIVFSTDYPPNYIAMNGNDSSILIMGDTAKAIRMLFVEFQKLSEKYYNCERRFDTAKMIYFESKYKDKLKW